MIIFIKKFIMDNLLVSIITPMYNGEKYVSQTIESVLDQTYQNWELIIVNDGSRDNSPAIVESYSLKDKRVRLIHQQNGGSASARNNALRHARGKYICFLDADDLLDSCFLEKQLNFLKSKDAAIAYASYRRINEENNEILRPFIVPDKVSYKGLLKTCSISCLTTIFDREKTGELFFDESLKSMRDDFVFWLSMLKKIDYAYGNKEILASYRVFASSTTGNKKKIVKPQFMVYYRVEKLGLVRSAYYFVHWMINGFLKYR